MMNSVKSRGLCLALLAFSLQFCLAQAPSGPLNFTFNTASTAVYDLSGGYDLSADLQGVGGTTTPISIGGLFLTHYPSGRLAGVGQIIVYIGSDPVTANYNLSGHVSGGGNQPVRVVFSVRMSGNGQVAGVQTGYSLAVHYNLEVNSASRSMLGTARGRLSLSRLSGGSIRSDNISIPLAEGVDGSWSAQMNILPGSSLNGTANIVLSDGRILPMHLGGNFSSATGLSHIHLLGYNNGQYDARGSNLHMSFLTGAVQLNTLTGRILGQKVIQ